MTSRPRTSGITLAASLLAMILGCDLSIESARLNEASGPRENQILKANVIEAQPSENVFRTASCYGTVRPTRSTHLAFAKGGRVAEVLKRVGDAVEADEKLAALDQQELEDQLQQIRSSLASAQENLTRLSANPLRNSSRTRINQLNQEVASLEAQQRELEKELERGVITAPFQGIVAERNIDVGNDLPVGRPAFKLVDDAPPVVELQVTSELARQISVEQKVWLIVDDGFVEARVAYISPELSAASLTQLLTLDIVDDDPDRPWVFGDAVEARFWIPTEKGGFWLPYSALQREHNGLWAAFVVEQNNDQPVVARRIVEIIQLVDDHALVRGAIGTGDKVIVEGSNRIVPGQQVTPSIVPATFSQAGPPPSRFASPESSE